MAARATASGTISFGLVSIPIKVYAATRSQSIHFNMLDARDHSRIKQQYVSANTGQVVERDQLVRGYEHARGQYVVFTEEELKALERESDRTIEIEEFVPMEEVDPVYFEKSNLLGPDKGGAKPYALLRQAMHQSGKVAIGRFAARGKQQLVLIRPTGEGLMMHGLYYADEVRSFADIELDEDVTLKKGELELALQLVEQLASESFAPEKYEDEYRRTVLEMVERKVSGQEVVVPEPAEEREQIIDLVAALKESLARPHDTGRPARADRKGAKAKGKDRAKGPTKKRGGRASAS